ncbi:MAG: hypothetical protein M3O34_12530 [Chloroflexota bacterium]|nr:hypothetical protein [Chloroflexota bacterium]
MTFTVDDFEDLVRLLEQRPEWRARLRELLLPRELLELPELVRDLRALIAAVQQQLMRVEARVEAVEVRVGAVETSLAEFRQDVDRRFALVDDRFDQVDRRFEQVDRRFDQVDRRFDQVESRLDNIVEDVGWLRHTAVRRDTDISELKGRDMERHYRDRAHMFDHLIPAPVPLTSIELGTWLGAQVQAGHLNPAEYQRILRVDIVFRGGDPTNPEYLAVEVSWAVDESDVRRAVQRAAVLRKTGVRARAVVAGRRIEPEAAALAEREGVAQVIEEELDAEDDGVTRASSG